MRHGAFRSAYAADAGEPIAALNITPLIDMMLVLLVMFILVLPALTHEVPLDLPKPAPDRTLPVTTHRLVLARNGGLALDGVAIGEAALRVRLGAIAADRQAELTLRTDPETRYERFDQVLALVKRAGVTRLGFEGKGDAGYNGSKIEMVAAMAYHNPFFGTNPFKVNPQCIRLVVCNPDLQMLLHENVLTIVGKGPPLQSRVRNRRRLLSRERVAEALSSSTVALALGQG